MKAKQTVKNPFDLAIAAIEAGDKEEAIDQVTRLNETALHVHDRMVQYINLMLSFVAEEMGEERVRDVWRYVIGRVHKKGVLALKGRTHDDVVKVFMVEHAAHGSTFSLEEREGKTEIILHCCGSGGRLRKNQLQSDEGKLKKRWPWGFGKEGISYYCSHCSIVSEDSPGWDADFKINVKFGKQFDQEGKPIEDPCRFEIIQKKKGSETP
ncbi:MAG: hypothetical protein H8D55_01410 [Deltaproteobacteria bacterium]|nr:hypothetical protein [Deltaproteobacteria bacterium]